MPGLEPRLRGSEPLVLPLHYTPLLPVAYTGDCTLSSAARSRRTSMGGGIRTRRVPVLETSRPNLRSPICLNIAVPGLEPRNPDLAGQRLYLGLHSNVQLVTISCTRYQGTSQHI